MILNVEFPNINWDYAQAIQVGDYPFMSYIATFASRTEALDAERKLKKWTRAKKEALINKRYDQLVSLAKWRNNLPPTLSVVSKREA